MKKKFITASLLITLLGGVFMTSILTNNKSQEVNAWIEPEDSIYESNFKWAGQYITGLRAFQQHWKDNLRIISWRQYGYTGEIGGSWDQVNNQLSTCIAVANKGVGDYSIWDFNSWEMDCNYDCTGSDYIVLFSNREGQYGKPGDPQNAITSIICEVGVAAKDEAFVKKVDGFDVTYYPVGCINYEDSDYGTYFPCCDFNADVSGSDDVHLYYAKDLRIGKPITNIYLEYATYNGPEEDYGNPHHNVSGRHYVQDQNGKDCDLNSGTGNDYVYLYYSTDDSRGYTITYKIPGLDDYISNYNWIIPTANNIYKPSLAGFNVEWYSDKDYSTKAVSGPLLDKDVTLYGKLTLDTSKTTAEIAFTFATAFVRMKSISESEKGTGLCKNYYEGVKYVLINILNDDVREYLIDHQDIDIVGGTYSRLKAWAKANGETLTIYVGGIIEIKSNSNIVITNNGDGGIYLTIIACVSMLAASAIGIYKKKKTSK